MKKTKKSAKPVLSLNIVERCKAVKWTGQDLADAIKIPYPTVRDILAGYSEGRLEHRKAIARALGCTLSDLYKEGATPADLNWAAQTLTQLAAVSDQRRAVVLYLLFEQDRFLEILDPKVAQSFEVLAKVL